MASGENIVTFTGADEHAVPLGDRLAHLLVDTDDRHVRVLVEVSIERDGEGPPLPELTTAQDAQLGAAIGRAVRQRAQFLAWETEVR